jgi:hypothetical protein
MTTNHDFLRTGRELYTKSTCSRWSATVMHRRLSGPAIAGAEDNDGDRKLRIYFKLNDPETRILLLYEQLLKSNQHQGI